MDLEKFRLRDAVEILLAPKQPIFFKTWALTRLLAWMWLDQRPRRRNPGTGRLSRPNRQRRDGKLAGHLALATLLDRRFSKSGLPYEDDKTLRGMFSLFLTSGGFGLFLKSPRGARRWLFRMRKSTEQLKYVYKILEYLCRYQQSNMNEGKFTIECAKVFVAETDKRLTKRTLGKYWETNKQAAPYIFAFYQFGESIIRKSESINDFVEALEQLAKNQKHLNRLLGEAAHAADILAGKARKVRRGDFEDVKRMKPQLSAFSADEVKTIDNVDPHKLSEKDAHDYRPKTISRMVHDQDR